MRRHFWSSVQGWKNKEHSNAPGWAYFSCVTSARVGFDSYFSFSKSNFWLYIFMYINTTQLNVSTPTILLLVCCFTHSRLCLCDSYIIWLHVYFFFVSNKCLHMDDRVELWYGTGKYIIYYCNTWSLIAFDSISGCSTLLKLFKILECSC